MSSSGGQRRALLPRREGDTNTFQPERIPSSRIIVSREGRIVVVRLVKSSGGGGGSVIQFGEVKEMASAKTCSFHS